MMQLETPLTNSEKIKLNMRAGSLQKEIKERSKSLRKGVYPHTSDSRVLGQILKIKDSELRGIEEILEQDLINKPAKFEPNSIYKSRYIGDSNLILFWEVKKVTAKRVTLLCLETDEQVTVAIRVDSQGNQHCYPEGQHSMALTVRAENISF